MTATTTTDAARLPELYRRRDFGKRIIVEWVIDNLAELERIGFRWPTAMVQRLNEVEREIAKVEADLAER